MKVASQMGGIGVTAFQGHLGDSVAAIQKKSSGLLHPPQLVVIGRRPPRFSLEKPGQMERAEVHAAPHFLDVERAALGHLPLDLAERSPDLGPETGADVPRFRRATRRRHDHELGQRRAKESGRRVSPEALLNDIPQLAFATCRCAAVEPKLHHRQSELGAEKSSGKEEGKSLSRPAEIARIPKEPFGKIIEINDAQSRARLKSVDLSRRGEQDVSPSQGTAVRLREVPTSALHHQAHLTVIVVMRTDAGSDLHFGGANRVAGAQEHLTLGNGIGDLNVNIVILFLSRIQDRFALLRQDASMNDTFSVADLLGDEFAAAREVKGAVYKIDTEEEHQLWGDFEFLRPETQTAWLSHFIALEFQLSRLQAGWIPATPSIEWRMEMPRFFFEDMQHAQALRGRLEEFRKGAKAILPPALDAFLRAIAGAESSASFFGQLFGKIKPALLDAYRRHLEKCDPVADGPTVYILERIIHEKEVQLTRASEILHAYPLASPESELADAYAAHVGQCLNLIGSLSPEHANIESFPPNPIAEPVGPVPDLELHDSSLRLSDKFPTNREECPVHNSLREIVYHMATEWQVIGPMCYAYYELTKMPFEFFVDFSRHIWDECRHARLGHRRLEELGFSRNDFIWPAQPNRPESVVEFIAYLTLVGEACSFKRKRGSVIPFLRLGDRRSALLPSIDCSDEQTHVGYGARWVPEIFKRYKNDERSLQEIAGETREAVVTKQHGDKLEEVDRRRLGRALPLFCTTVEFTHLDFTRY